MDRIKNHHFVKASANRFPVLKAVVIWLGISIFVGSAFMILGWLRILVWICIPALLLFPYCSTAVSRAFGKTDQLIVEEGGPEAEDAPDGVQQQNDGLIQASSAQQAIAVVQPGGHEAGQGEEVLGWNERQVIHLDRRAWLATIRAHRDILDLARSNNMRLLTARQVDLFSELAETQKRDNVVAFYAPRPWAETCAELDRLKSKHGKEFKQLLAQFSEEKQHALNVQLQDAVVYFGLFQRLLELCD